MNDTDKETANKVANELLSDLSTDNLKSSLKLELRALGRISEALQHLDKKSAARVLKWAEDRFLSEGD